MKLRVDYAYDPESRNWGFRVPSLGIIGSADTREEARQAAIAAIAFTLDGVDQDDPPDPDAELEYLELKLEQPSYR